MDADRRSVRPARHHPLGGASLARLLLRRLPVLIPGLLLLWLVVAALIPSQ